MPASAHAGGDHPCPALLATHMGTGASTGSASTYARFLRLLMLQYEALMQYAIEPVERLPYACNICP
jgi:hypothetical protein